MVPIGGAVTGERRIAVLTGERGARIVPDPALEVDEAHSGNHVERLVGQRRERQCSEHVTLADRWCFNDGRGGGSNGGRNGARWRNP